MTHKLDELKALTDTQAAELYADLKAAGNLTPPPGVMAYTVERLPANLSAFTQLLLGQAAAWEGIAPPDSALHFYGNGLIYALAMLRSCEQVAASPVQVFVMFGIWCTSFAREVMTDSGLSAAQQEATLEDDEGAAAALNALAHPMAKGALGAALAVMSAAVTALGLGELAAAERELVSMGAYLAGPDFVPPAPGGGLKA